MLSEAAAWAAMGPPLFCAGLDVRAAGLADRPLDLRLSIDLVDVRSALSESAFSSGALPAGTPKSEPSRPLALGVDASSLARAAAASCLALSSSSSLVASLIDCNLTDIGCAREGGERRTG